MPGNADEFLKALVDNAVLTEREGRELADQYRGDSVGLLQHVVGYRPRQRELVGSLWGNVLNIAYVDPTKTIVDYDLASHIPHDFAKNRCVIPLYEFGGAVTVATPTPEDIGLRGQVEGFLDRFVSPVFAFPDQVESAVEIAYQTDSALASLVAECVARVTASGSHLGAQDLARLSKDKAIIDFSRGLMLLAIRRRASDIHIEPGPASVRIRFRIDGVLQRVLTMERALLLPMVLRLKVMADLDISEVRRPQDGRIEVAVPGHAVAFRMSTVPTVYGEKVVLRLLGQSEFQDVPDLGELGFAGTLIDKLRKVARAPNGIFFVTGPTGSGKSTTLYSILKFLNSPGINIMTVENPVEYALEGANQIQVNEQVGVTFAEMLKHFLRQDPDVILVGEVRDLDTAQIAARAALTGHLVFTTMHTNSSFQAVTRLLDLGVDPALLAPCVLGVMAQRLVRRLCQNCREPYDLSAQDIQRMFESDGTTPVRFYRPVGCGLCNQVGYRGRIAIQECFLLDEALRSLIASRANYDEIVGYGLSHGFKPLRYDGLKKVLQGVTTIEDLDRVTWVE